ncbi:MAG: threonine synthase [Sphingobacteriaceae bacterium]
MKLYSTNNPALSVDFPEAVFNSLPADKGLYMPVHIPTIDPVFLENIEKYTLPEIAFEVAKTLLQQAIPDQDLKAIIDDAINFPAPAVKLDEETYVLELFHGPSLAFKDFGARFMSRVMAYFLKAEQTLLDVLVATSGDTGGAVAAGFLGVPNTRVTILYPKGKVSEIQKLQLTTNGKNVYAIEIDGTFDDCQALVKAAFLDKELSAKFRLTSANSINIARLIPQTFYYFNAYAQLKRTGKKEIVFAVPSGNFGNIGAGILAYQMGLPVKQFVAATNVNDTVPVFLKTGVYEPKASVQTFSNAMDVGNPSNWVRISNLFENKPDELKQLIKAYSFNDEQTIQAIQEIFTRFQYVACPHTAIAWLGIAQWQKENPDENTAAVFLSTAHACKFPDVLPKNIAGAMEVPEQIKHLSAQKSQYADLGKDFESFKQYLLSR